MSTLPTWVNTYAQSEEQRYRPQPWLNALRQKALERFAEEGWPTNKIEEWRHTSMMRMEQRSYEPVTQDYDQAAVQARLKAIKAIDPNAHWAVFVNGRLQAELSDLEGFNPKGQCLNTAEALQQEDSPLKDKWGLPEDGFTPQALNLALAHEGLYVQVPRGVHVETALHIVYVHAQDNAATFNRCIFDLEDGAQLRVVEHHISTSTETALNNTVCRAWLGRDAHLFHLRLQQENTETVHLSAFQAFQEQSSHLETHAISLGAGLARSEIETNFNGEHGYALLNGLYFVDGKRHVDHNTVMNHNQPNCHSHEYFRGIMDDRGRGVFTGRIRVAEGADGTDAIQRSDSLLLAKLARADSRPELEIFADDVKCAHGATVGQLDQDSMFYLRSRGLSEAEARDVLIYAFAIQVIQRIQPEHLRMAATDGIQNLLPAGLDIAQEQV